MTTDTKAVARMDWGNQGMVEKDNGNFIHFTDHERVVGELAHLDFVKAEVIRDFLSDIEVLKSALAASRAEVDGLKKMLPEVQRCVEYAIDYGSPSRRTDRKELLNIIDAAMEKRNV